MTETKKISAKPLFVSHCDPVYVNDKLKYYQVKVSFAGDLRLMAPAVISSDLVKNPALYNEPLLHEMMQPVLNPKIKLPNILHAYSLTYDDTDNTTLISYAFRNDLFGIGANRAWKFRLRMLGELRKAKDENIK